MQVALNTDKNFVKHLGATCPMLPRPRAFMPTSQLQTTLVSTDVQLNQLSAPDQGRALGPLVSNTACRKSDMLN